MELATTRYDEVRQLTIWQKQKIYSHYLSTMLLCKYQWYHVKVDADKKEDGYGEPTKKIGNVGLYQALDTKIMSFLEFTSDKNIRVIDNGDDWQCRGFAQKVRVDAFGIYDWHNKFKSEINYN